MATQLAVLDSESLPAALPVAPDVDAAWHYDYREIGWHQLPLPEFQDPAGDDAPLLAIDGLPANVAPVVAIHHGLWIADGGRHCRPGRHITECRHRDNLTITSHARLAELLYGTVGGKQVRLIRRALEHATRRTVRYNAWDPVRRSYFEYRCHLLSLIAATHLPKDARRLVATSGTIALAADPFVHRRMMVGAYQEIPGPLVRHLSGSGFLIWATALTQPATAHLRRAGDIARFRIAGRGRGDRYLRPDSMALGSMRRDKRLVAIARAADGGNQLQDEWELSLSGELLLLRRRVDRARARPKVQGSVASNHVPAGVPPDVASSVADVPAGVPAGVPPDAIRARQRHQTVDVETVDRETRFDPAESLAVLANPIAAEAARDAARRVLRRFAPHLLDEPAP